MEQTREAFAIVDFDPTAANNFYIDDDSDSLDQFTPNATGDNRQTGLTADDPKSVPRSIFLSYPLGSNDVLRVDTGDYILAINQNIRRTPLDFDPRLNTVSDASMIGPTNLNLKPTLDRANPHPGAVAFDLRDAPSMTFHNLEIFGANVGVRVREASTDFSGTELILRDHGADGISFESGSDSGLLEDVDVFNNGRHGIYVDSLLDHIKDANVYDNGEIGMALRDVGGAVIENSDVHGNGIRGVDILNHNASTAVVGHSNLPDLKGNFVHENVEEGIFASGNVLVAGNHVWVNNEYGIRLDDGADALRNVVHDHDHGISARGSSSDIDENRVYLNAVTAIEASYLSNIRRNVTYSSDVHQIHADRFGGFIENNLAYQTGDTTVHIEGPGEDARFINNTVYETCNLNDGEPHIGPTEIDIEWDLDVFMQPPPGPNPGFNGLLWGEAGIAFNEPVGLVNGGTFSLGPGGTSTSLTEEPVPMGEMFQIDFSLADLALDTSMSPPIPGLGVMTASLAPGMTSAGTLLVENLAGTLSGSVDLLLFLQFTFSDAPNVLVPEIPYIVSRSFDPTDGFNGFQVLQIAGMIPADPGRPPGSLIDLFNPSAQPWQWDIETGDQKPVEIPDEQHRGDTCAEIAVLVDNNMRNVYFRNNIVYAEGDSTGGLPINSLDVVVDSDSTDGWRSENNILTTIHGDIGSFSGATAPDIGTWQTISSDDDQSISPLPSTIWVDPDGNDNAQGGANGFDDNFHQLSPFGEADSGALAPILDGGTDLPLFEAVNFVVDANPLVKDVSPGVDWGDPSFPFFAEPLENGLVINLGAYGGTAQASHTPTEYINVVFPLEPDQLFFGGNYDIRWRSDGLSTVNIELLRGGQLETTIATAVANNGSFPWTIPGGLTVDNTYEIKISRLPSILFAETEIAGTTRTRFSIDADSMPPVVAGITPDLLDTLLPATTWPSNHHLPTNQNLTNFTITYSENLDATSAMQASNYELRSAGPAGNTTFGDGDDVVSTLTTNYTPGLTDSDPSTVDLNAGVLPLPEGTYRLTVSSNVSDPAGNALDGNGNGIGGDSLVEFFTIDQSGPSVTIPPITPDPTNQSFDTLTIEFDEAVRGFGLSDLRISQNDPNGPNLLTGHHTLASPDAVTWTLGNLSQLTADEGIFYLALDHNDSEITDLAGNALLNSATDDWEIDLTAPVLTITPIAPDPRNTAVTTINFDESEPISDLRLGDLIFDRDGTPITGVLNNITGTEGIYFFSFEPDTILHDLAGNTMDTFPSEVWQVFTSSPSADVVDVTPDPRNQAVDTIIVNFTRQVVGMDSNDLTLTRNGSGNLLTGGETLESLDGIHYILSGLTGVAGDYTLTLTSGGSGITDLAGNPLVDDSSDTWTMDVNGPSLVDIVDVAPDPRNGPVTDVTFVFDKPVTGFDINDLELIHDNGTPSANLLTASQTLSTSDNVTWTLDNLAGLTDSSGTYQLTLTASASGISDAANNLLAAGGAESWTTDVETPEVDIVDVVSDPRTIPVDSMTIVFNEPVSGLDVTDLTFRHNDGRIC